MDEMNRMYIVKRPHGLSHKGFNITTAFYRLEDDLGNCPVYEIRGMRKQEGPEDEKEEPVAGVALIGISGSTGCMDVCPVL
ncbi:hypothetical protein CDL15_Pgr013859 [Punica granatum]|uniref:Uncharacterized protein n=1 Tax=Punica granatum TaxID=22663 RepID=A0A218WI42_PUNGR|nr:hypothetical protein CDL15_Pgr013859 [Punica granatum]